LQARKPHHPHRGMSRQRPLPWGQSTVAISPNRMPRAAGCNVHDQLCRAMKPGANNERVYRMAFARVYPLYITKVEKKGRTKEELHTIIHWLTGYTEKGLQQVLDKNVDFETF